MSAGRGSSRPTQIRDERPAVPPYAAATSKGRVVSFDGTHSLDASRPGNALSMSRPRRRAPTTKLPPPRQCAEPGRSLPCAVLRAAGSWHGRRGADHRRASTCFDRTRGPGYRGQPLPPLRRLAQRSFLLRQARHAQQLVVHWRRMDQTALGRVMIWQLAIGCLALRLETKRSSHGDRRHKIR